MSLAYDPLFGLHPAAQSKQNPCMVNDHAVFITRLVIKNWERKNETRLDALETATARD